MTMNIQGFRARQYGVRKVPECLHREMQVHKKLSAPVPEKNSARRDWRTKKFGVMANKKGATLPQIIKFASEVGITDFAVVRGFFIKTILLMSGVYVIKANDLLKMATDAKVLNDEGVQDAIAAAHIRDNRPKDGGARATVLAAGKFVPPA